MVSVDVTQTSFSLFVAVLNESFREELSSFIGPRSETEGTFLHGLCCVTSDQ